MDRATIQVALALPVRAGRYLAGRRLGDPAFEGCWEFPGGKIRDEEPAATAACRELLEETGLAAITPDLVCVIRHRYDDRDVELHCFRFRNWSGEIGGEPDREWTWFTLAELNRLPMPEANRRILAELGRE